MTPPPGLSEGNLDWSRLDIANHLLIWLVGGSGAFGLVHHWIRYRSRTTGWLAIFATQVVIVLLGLVFWPEKAGWVGAAVWFPFVFLPAIGNALVHRWVLREYFGLAAVLAYAIAWLHPFDGWLRLPRYIQVLRDIHHGHPERAREMLATIPESEGQLARFVKLQLLRFEGDWEEVIRTISPDADPARVDRDPNTAAMYLRALGETGRTDALVQNFAAVSAGELPPQTRALQQLFFASFTGDRGLTNALLDGPFSAMPAETRRYWEATTAQCAGDAEEAEGTLNEIVAHRGDSVLADAIRRRIASPLPVAEIPPERQEMVDHTRTQIAAELQFGAASSGRAWGTSIMILASLIGFALQLPEGSLSEANHLRLGALIPLDAPGGGWWRVWTAGFLHHGPIHLSLNLLALWILGRRVENAVGGWGLIVIALVATVGANAAYLPFLPSYVEGEPFPKLVGASGGVMGVFGAAVVLAAIGWRRHQVTVLRSLLFRLLAILILQMIFDASVEQICGEVHLLGFGLGVLTTLALVAIAPQRILGRLTS